MKNTLPRRKALQWMGYAGLAAITNPLAPVLCKNSAMPATDAIMLKRPIPSSGEQLPVVGLGT